MPDLTSSTYMSLTRVALKEALKSDGKHRLGAVALNGTRVLAKGCNSYATFKHAEVAALCRVPYELRRGCSILVVRAMRSKEFGNSRPCPDCQKFLRDQGVKVVYYTTDAGKLEAFQIELDS